MSQRLRINCESKEYCDKKNYENYDKKHYDKKHYDIVISHTFKDLMEEVAALSIADRKVCIVTDSNVAPLYGDEVELLLKDRCAGLFRFVFPAGEEQKTLETVVTLYKFLLDKEFERNDILMALGGGVVGDLTGFTAATYLRGIDYIQIPTTLLSQTDSSIGGKTGVDFEGFKNMVGAFYMPKLIYINVSTLRSLPDRQYYSGFAEIMKYGLIKDGLFYEWLLENMYEIREKDNDVLEEMIVRSCAIKKMIVEMDPLEKGERALLNFGHTIGHAIEKASGFRLHHGECVALGAVAAAFISWKREWLSMEEYYEIRDMFVPFQLPITIEDMDPQEILRLTKADKKREGDNIKFILLKKVGRAVIDRNVSDEDIINALNEINYTEEKNNL